MTHRRKLILTIEHDTIGERSFVWPAAKVLKAWAEKVLAGEACDDVISDSASSERFETQDGFALTAILLAPNQCSRHLPGEYMEPYLGTPLVLARFLKDGVVHCVSPQIETPPSEPS